MTPAFRHHDKIASAMPGEWLRCIGPVKACILGPVDVEVTLPAETLMRVKFGSNRNSIYAQIEDGDRLRTVVVFDEWWHHLDLHRADGDLSDDRVSGDQDSNGDHKIPHREIGD